MLCDTGLVDIHFHGCVEHMICVMVEEYKALADYGSSQWNVAIVPATMTIQEEKEDISSNETTRT